MDICQNCVFACVVKVVVINVEESVMSHKCCLWGCFELTLSNRQIAHKNMFFLNFISELYFALVNLMLKDFFSNLEPT